MAHKVRLIIVVFLYRGASLVGNSHVLVIPPCRRVGLERGTTAEGNELTAFVATNPRAMLVALR